MRALRTRGFVRRVLAPRTFEDRLLRAGYAFALPALIVYCVVVVYPTISTTILSFYKWTGFTKSREWVGLGNYVRLANDELVRQAFVHNLVWVVGAVCFPLFFGLIASVLMTSNIAGRYFFRVVFYLPMIFPPVVTAIVWQWMFATSIGLVNSFLRFIGLGFLAQPWLGRPETALLALIGVFAWIFFGFCVVIILAALQTVDPNLKEAARIDGANAPQITIYITLPSIRHELEFMVLFMVITAMKVFNLPYIMTGGGPGYATEVVATVMYQKAFGESQMGYGAAIATALMVVVVAAYALSRMRRKEA